MGAKIEDRERKAAKERQKDHGGTAPGKSKNTSEKFTGVKKGDARDKIAKAVGNVSGVTYERAKKVTPVDIIADRYVMKRPRF